MTADRIFPPGNAGLLKGAFVVFGAWTLFGMLSSAHFFLAANASDTRSLVEYARHIVVFYWGWALLTPGVFFLARRLTSPWTAARWGVLIGAGAVFIAVHGVVYTLGIRLLGIHPERQLDAVQLRDYFIRHGGGDAATYLVLVGGYLFFQANRRARAREVAAAELEVRLARADSELLRWRLHPHFVFNALNTVSTLVLKSDMAGAERAISLIAQYLRSTLKERTDSLVPLEQEVQQVKNYVEIEALRFGESLRIECHVDDDAARCSIPGMILQPIVENAIQHGIAGAGQGHRILLGASMSSGRLVITIADPGLGDPAVSPRDEGGFGIPYVRERLRHSYGDEARFELQHGNSGTIATLDVPADSR